MLADIYLSGRFTINTKIEKAWLKRTGCKHRCFSFAFVNPDKIPGMPFNKKVASALKVCEDNKINIMLDSGAFSLHVIARKTSKRTANAKAKQQIDINELQKQMFEKYVKFCHAGKEKWAFYITLDFKQDQKIIYAMQQKFAANGLAPVPVFHGDSDVSWLHKHLDMGHKFVCIGGAPKRSGRGGLNYYLEQVFNFGAKHGQTYHGLAMTSLDIIMSWPFASVDSSTWSQTAAYGMIILPDVKRRKFLNVHVSSRGSSNKNSHHSMSVKQRDELKELLRHHDFDLEAMKDSEVERHDWNGFVMSNLGKFGVTQQLKKTWQNLF